MFDKESQNKLREEFRILMADVWGKDNHMIDYCVKDADLFIKTSQGYIMEIEKPRIETSFCFGYHDYVDGDYERANNMADFAEKDFDYFREKNLEKIQFSINWLSETNKKFYFRNHYCSQTMETLKSIESFQPWDEPADVFKKEFKIYKPVPDEDRLLLIKAYEVEKERFSKRIETYLKRYGLSKVRTWSYWADE